MKERDKNPAEGGMNRRELLKTMSAATAGAVASAVPAVQAASEKTATQVKNPYGGGPNTGITLQRARRWTVRPFRSAGRRSSLTRGVVSSCAYRRTARRRSV